MRLTLLEGQGGLTEEPPSEMRFGKGYVHIQVGNQQKITLYSTKAAAHPLSAYIRRAHLSCSACAGEVPVSLQSHS